MDMVTIGIPFLNAESTLAIAIESVLMQTHENFRLILMNDGSTDGSMNVARQYAIDRRVEQVGDVEEQVTKDLTIARLRQQLNFDVACGDMQPEQVDVHRCGRAVHEMRQAR